jgi:hypothetical protein
MNKNTVIQGELNWWILVLLIRSLCVAVELCNKQTLRVMHCNRN